MLSVHQLEVSKLHWTLCGLIEFLSVVCENPVNLNFFIGLYFDKAVLCPKNLLVIYISSLYSNSYIVNE